MISVFCKRPSAWSDRQFTPCSTFAKAPSTSAPSTSAGDVTLDVIMVKLQRMDAHLDALTDELCQVNTSVGRIARE
ncbi:hypothetical protein SO802_003947 [Lithocarpus litseifolius]|uniref:Uncharacterized protein n=1 Tax=Lithocarpus litseifolius TaxID=425828 RepID=A0AAW2E1N0_9ROSI